MEYKAYSFDLDDNLLVLPTKVILTNNQGNKKLISTKKFEKIRYTLKEKELKITNETFKNFENDENFLEDIKKGKEAGSWKYLIECITKHASIFSIITARGHSPEIIKLGLKEKLLETLSKEQLNQFKRRFKLNYKGNLKNKTIEEIFDIYLKTCRFYPCNHPTIKNKYGDKKNVSELKAILFRDFRKYLQDYVKTNIGDNINIKMGFSDDSLAHLGSVANSVLKDYGFFFFHGKENGISEFISSYSS